MLKHRPIKILDHTEIKWGISTPPEREDFMLTVYIEYRDTYKQEPVEVRGTVIYHDFLQKPEIKITNPPNLHPALKRYVAKIVRQELPDVRNSFSV